MDKSEWSGRVGDVWAEQWRRTDRTFGPVNAALIAAAAERIAGIAAPAVLDVGCGAGTTSLTLAGERPDAAITGIDLSAALLMVARSRAGDGGRCRFEQSDAGRWEGGSGFDLILSRHGVMFFDDPVAAFAHLRSLAKLGGALAFSCFRSAAENVWASGLAHLMPGGAADPHAPGPFAFADDGRVADVLSRAGWRDASARPLDFAYVAGAGADPVADAIDFFRLIGPTARAVRDLGEADRERLMAGLADHVRAHHDGDRVVFPAAAWIWNATA